MDLWAKITLEIHQRKLLDNFDKPQLIVVIHGMSINLFITSILEMKIDRLQITFAVLMPSQ